MVGADDGGGHHQTHETSETFTLLSLAYHYHVVAVQCGATFSYFYLSCPLTLYVWPHFPPLTLAHDQDHWGDDENVGQAMQRGCG